MAADGDHDPWTSRGMYEAAKVLASYSYGTDLSETQKFQMAYAMGWFSGSMSGMEAAGAFMPEQKFICIQGRPAVGDIARGYVGYVDRLHGHMPDQPLVILVEALKHDFPCK